MGPKGNKGVDFQPVLYHSIYILFFYQIPNQVDSGFPSCFSGVFAGLIYIKTYRMVVPVVPIVPMGGMAGEIPAFSLLPEKTPSFGKLPHAPVSRVNPAGFPADLPGPYGMEFPRKPVPVVPCAPMEIKGLTGPRFPSSGGDPQAGRISERNSSMRLRAVPRSSRETAYAHLR